MRVLLTLVYLAFAAAGAPVLRLRFVRERTWAARWSIAIAAGTTATTVALLMLNAVGIRWTAPLLALLLLVAMGFALRAPAFHRHPDLERGSSIGFAIAGLALILLALALFTGRATSTDYLYFWGTKGFRFARAGGIDLPFLARPDHYRLHSDYPPLVPVVYAAASLVLGSRSWWLGIAGTLFFGAASVLAVYGLCREGLGARMAGALAGFSGAAVAAGLVVPFSGGNAEAILIFLECVALGLLTMHGRERAAEWLASIALLGTVLAKIEGSVFALLVVLVYGIVRENGSRRARRLVRLGLLPLAGLAGWLAFATAHGILNGYSQPYGPFTLHFLGPALGAFLRAASFDAAYLLWIVPAAIVLASPRLSAALRPAAVGALFAGFAFFCFLHGAENPSDWIRAVAPRLLMTTVLCLAAAAAAATAPTLPVTEPRKAAAAPLERDDGRQSV